MHITEINPLETAFHPSKAEWERLLSRVVESTPFRRSARLRDFLIYVGNEVILHGAEDLTEQQVGVAVFGRSDMYDTSQDNIVRVNAMELRKRIDLYFANEGHAEPLVFEIPRGRYVPIFHPRALQAIEDSSERPVETTETVAVAAESPAHASSHLPELTNPLPIRPPYPLRQIVLGLIVVVLTVCLGVEVRCNQLAQATLHKWQSGPALRAFWVNFFGKGFPPEIVLADTSFVLARDVLHKQLSLAEYLDYSYRSAQSPDPMSNEAREQEHKDLATIFKQNAGSIGDFRVARRLTELEPGEDSTRLVFAREYAGHRLQWNNTIFIGSSKSNPWVELFDDRMAYHFKWNQDQTQSVVTVDHPIGTEQAQYELSNGPGTKTAYCIIVFLPNPTGTGSTLIVAGSDSQATEAGGDFLTTEESLKKLQTLLQQKTFPYFQVLLRIPRSNGTPLGSEIVSYRIVSK